MAHLHSSAGTLPRQHVFLRSAVGAMATMNLAKNPSDLSIWPKTIDDEGAVEAALRDGKRDNFHVVYLCLLTCSLPVVVAAVVVVIATTAAAAAAAAVATVAAVVADALERYTAPPNNIPSSRPLLLLLAVTDACF